MVKGSRDWFINKRKQITNVVQIDFLSTLLGVVWLLENRATKTQWALTVRSWAFSGQNALKFDIALLMQKAEVEAEFPPQLSQQTNTLIGRKRVWNPHVRGKFEFSTNFQGK